MKIKLINFSEKLLYITLILLPLIFISGKFLADLAIVLSALLFLNISILSRKSNYLFSKYSIIFFLFNSYLILRSLFSTDILLSLESSLFLFRFWLFALAIYYIIKKKINFIKYYIYLSLSIILIIFIDSLIQFIFGVNLTGNLYLGERISSFFGNEYILGGYIGRQILVNLAIITYVFYFDKYKNFITMLLFSFSLIIILLSGDRVGILYFIISFISFIIVSEHRKIIKIYLSTLFLMSFISIIFFVENIYNRVVITSLRQFRSISQDIDNGNLLFFSSGLNDIYNTALNIFSDNKIFGIGPKMFRKYCLDEKYLVGDGCTTHPHNYLIQIFTETGIIGFFFYSFFIIFLTFNLITSLVQRIRTYNSLYLIPKIYFNIILLVHLLPFYPTGSIFNNFTTLQLILPLGFYLYFFYKDKQNINIL